MMILTLVKNFENPTKSNRIYYREETVYHVSHHILNHFHGLSNNIFLESHPSIPQGEIRLKIGGDHVSGSFK